MDEVKNVEQPTNGTIAEDTSALLELVAELKQNSVSRDAYDQLMDRNKQLVSHLLNGTPAPDVEPKKQDDGRSIDELRKIVLSRDADVGNLAYAEATLELRRKLMDDGKPDPLLPFGNGIAPTETERANANMFVQVLEHCIDEAQGDEQAFQSAFARCIAPDSRPTARRKI